MGDTLPFSEVKAHPSELADRVERQHDRILVTRNGRPSFVLLSPDDLAALEESPDVLQHGELIESLRTSRRQAARPLAGYGLIARVCPPSRGASPGDGTSPARSTSSSTGTRSQTSGATKPANDCATTTSSPLSPTASRTASA